MENSPGTFWTCLLSAKPFFRLVGLATCNSNMQLIENRSKNFTSAYNHTEKEVVTMFFPLCPNQATIYSEQLTLTYDFYNHIIHLPVLFFLFRPPIFHIP